MRTRRSFRVVLNAEGRQRVVFHAFDRLVVEVDVRNSNFLQVQAVRIDGEAVILRRDLHLVQIRVQHRLIPAVVSELQLVCPAAEGQPHDLMPEADPEDRLLAEQLRTLRIA